MKKYYFLLLIFPFFSAFGHEYHFRVLPSSYNIDFQNINLLYQSSDKLMWLGTGIGLYSFDGRKYNYFPRPDELRQRVTAITEGPGGQIWAGYEDGHIVITNFQGKQQIFPFDSLHGASISKIVFLPDHDVAIATYGKGFGFYMNTNWNMSCMKIWRTSMISTTQSWIRTEKFGWAPMMVFGFSLPGHRHRSGMSIKKMDYRMILSPGYQ
jgi:ligand-binding sensor domain-containing protein